MGSEVDWSQKPGRLRLLVPARLGSSTIVGISRTVVYPDQYQRDSAGSSRSRQNPSSNSISRQSIGCGTFRLVHHASSFGGGFGIGASSQFVEATASPLPHPSCASH